MVSQQSLRLALSSLGLYLLGHRRTAIFAITCACNCRCIMCNMHRLDPARLPARDGMRVLDFLHDNKFMAVYFTGGEPTLHPDLIPLVQYANELGPAISDYGWSFIPLGTVAARSVPS